MLVAKLDRLSRNKAFLFTLRESGAKLVFADMPDANELTLDMLSIMAQYEREQISARTKAALAAAKARCSIAIDKCNAMPALEAHRTGQLARCWRTAA